ncbi:hypothetical protein HO520_10775 [Streptococcus suis]|nr:hypothetical protein [Streptococcus suis]
MKNKFINLSKEDLVSTEGGSIMPIYLPNFPPRAALGAVGILVSKLIKK